jgi:KaiC/GvpD/RAD55 family RecA-like ATPase
MDNKKQKLLIEYLLSSTDTFALCQHIVLPDYFDPEFRNAIIFTKEYYDKYNTTPSAVQVEAETGLTFNIQEITKDQISYCSDEIETFCKRRAIEKAIIASPELIAKGDYGAVENKIRDAIMVSLNRDLGLRYFDTVEDRIARMLKDDPTEPTGWIDVDDVLFGGISRKELLLVSANSGGGKSITLANLALNFIERKRNVLYISLELSEDIVAQRFDTMFTGIGRKIWKEHSDEIIMRVKGKQSDSGIIDVIQKPAGTSATEIRAYLKEFYLKYGYIPDLLVVDYLDNMGPNEQVSADNISEKDKRCSEQLRQIGVDLNMFTATASQLNRSAINATSHDHSQIAGGITKINVADVYWSIIMTDVMRAEGVIMFIIQKTRNSDGVGSKILLKWDSKYLRIRNGDRRPDKQNPLDFISSAKFNNPIEKPKNADDITKLIDL